MIKWLLLITHFLIDFIRIYIDKRFPGNSVRFWSFITDQILHMVILIVTVFCFDLEFYQIGFWGRLTEWQPLKTVLVYGIIFIILWNPVSIFIKELFLYIFGNGESADDTREPKVGSLIGKLERLIIAVLVLEN